jgi:hypothetical protein
MYEGACNISFTLAPNDVTLPGIYKMILTSATASFPADSKCGRGYWLAISVTGSFAFVDTNHDVWCVSFLALANPSAYTTSGTFTTLAKTFFAHNETSFGAGFNGTYNTTAASIIINFDSYSATYALDPSSTQTSASPQSFVNIIPRTKAATPFKVSGASPPRRGGGGTAGWALSLCLAAVLCAGGPLAPRREGG